MVGILYFGPSDNQKFYFQWPVQSLDIVTILRKKKHCFLQIIITSSEIRPSTSVSTSDLQDTESLYLDKRIAN